MFNEDEPDVKEALALSDPEVRIARTRRIKRALDLGLKQKNFLDYAPDVDQETFTTDLDDMIKKIRMRDHEFALMNAHKR